MPIRIHSSAEVSESAEIGEGTSIWHQCQVREGAKIGQNCILGRGVYVDAGVQIGDNVKIQNYVSIYHGVTIQDGVFIGPHVCFTNDLHPRAINPDYTIKGADDWVLSPTLIKRGAALGANSTIICGISIGEWALVGSGSVVSKVVPDYGLVYGNPARLRGFVCPCGEKMIKQVTEGQFVKVICPDCGFKTEVDIKKWEKIK
jgi:UDP-2-acetamido-3-amino-2,3-dideoxy-glucuronate N-acetyltransferase